MTLLIPFLIGCGGSGGKQTAETTTPTLTSVEWVMAWDGSATETRETGGWSTTSDLGYEIEVDEGWVLTYLLSLVPCETEADTGALAWLGWIFGAPALADHAPFSDPSLVELSAVEGFDSPSTLSLGPFDFPEQTYCSIYWLVARGEPETAAAGTSLRVSGMWQRGSETGVLEIDTDFALALIEDIPPISMDQSDLQVTLARPLATLFDGIDFADANSYQQSWQMLSNLVEGADISAK